MNSIFSFCVPNKSKDFISELRSFQGVLRSNFKFLEKLSRVSVNIELEIFAHGLIAPSSIDNSGFGIIFFASAEYT